ncbi:MAG: aminopeptidase [Clostridiales bacterium]|jgi:aminopeptidase|nr:aminopeptidase [Clostridiales bacterium]
MLSDPRIKKLAKNLVRYSCDLQKGEKILIEFSDSIHYQLINHIIREVFDIGGFPFVQMSNDRIKRELLRGMSVELADFTAKYDAYRMGEMDAYIGIRGSNNVYELSDVPAENRKIYDVHYSMPVHHNIRVDKTKWVILRYPTEAMSQQSKMTTEAFEDFYFKVCNLDYQKMSDAMDGLVELMNKTDRVRLTAKGTDLSFSIKDIAAIKCSGLRNIPDGEVYTAPVKDSVEGVISYNAPSIYNGIEFSGMKLTFSKGKIVKAEAAAPELTKAANKIFDTDGGARFVGEFAIGVNPYVKKAMGDILFDEKISGSIHFTPGSCYTEASNGNQSAVHWDLVLIQTKEFGGGEIYFDGRLIRKNGIFVVPELESLNPENLK